MTSNATGEEESEQGKRKRRQNRNEANACMKTGVSYRRGDEKKNNNGRAISYTNNFQRQGEKGEAGQKVYGGGRTDGVQLCVQPSGRGLGPTVHGPCQGRGSHDLHGKFMRRW